ncbi:O-methyltransferase involved in polyketide biosynthesis [Streptomyces eurocidicus]|uniref:O-methyltransferase involved in polyketide biosynthesis n=1 Tax=Streptomyces eurocidicus TaxID=66423 RepID=A0A7W8F377_STREU|nr:O-methyltransferase involved in polyketide biosynthesis [Streptomyces eurocidicus]
MELTDRCDWPFQAWFGRPHHVAEQYLARRARMYDAATTRFLRRHPGATVIALGEGLETQFWRADNGTAHWLSVDRPEVIELRRAVLPHGPRQHAVACSVTDPRWTDHAVARPPSLIAAQGLFMYLRPPQAAALIRLCVRRFPRSVLLFDTLPHVTAHLAPYALTRGGTFRFPTLRGAIRPSALRLGDTGQRHAVTVRSIGPYAIGPRATARLILAAQRSWPVREALLPALVRLDIP